MKRYYFVLTLLFVLSLTSSLWASNRPNYLGFAPPLPKNMPDKFTPPSNPPYLTYERQVLVIAGIDASGQVMSVQPQDSLGSRFAKYVEAYLKSARFEPAELNGDKTNSRLPLKVTFRPGRKYPDFLFPVDTGGMIKDRELFFSVFPLNDIYPPALVMFPKYFSDQKWNDSASLYPFVLLKLSLDDRGQPTDVKEIYSTIPSYTQTTMSASLWAKYEPAKVKEQATATKCFLAVSYFPQIDYPTAPWKAKDIDSLIILQKVRVQLIPDTIGVMQKPLPKKLPGNLFSIANQKLYVHDTISALMVVDTLGKVSFRRYSKLDKAHRQIIKDLLVQFDFYPALAYDGKPVTYSGLVNITFISSGKIRIDYKW